MTSPMTNQSNTSRGLTEAKAEGFIIANRGWSESEKLGMGMRTFGRTAGEAWQRHVGGIIAASPDFPIIIQRWSDKGFGPHRVEAVLVKEPAGRAALQEQKK